MKLHSIVKHQHGPLLSMATCAFLSLGLGAASAQVYAPPTYVPGSGQDLGFYLSGGLGPSFIPDFRSPRFGFPGYFSADPGVRFSAEPGYNFLATDRLTIGGEFETGVIYNHLSSVIDSAALTPRLRGEYYQVPLLGNLVLKFHPNAFVVPYLGVGGGGDYSSAEVHSPGFFGFRSMDDQVDPALQGMAGVRFQLTSDCDVGLGYKFLAAFPNHGDEIETHSVQATFTVRF